MADKIGNYKIPEGASVSVDGKEVPRNSLHGEVSRNF